MKSCCAHDETPAVETTRRFFLQVELLLMALDGKVEVIAHA